jgi:hypothetical protein
VPFVVKENPIGLGSLVIRGFLGQKGIIQFLRNAEANSDIEPLNI